MSDLAATWGNLGTFCVRTPQTAVDSTAGSVGLWSSPCPSSLGPLPQKSP